MPAQPITVSSTLEERLKGRRAALDVLRALPEEYQLFYNPSQRGKDAATAAEPAIDYILSHKYKGLVGVVVKSGEIVEEPGGFISQFQPQKQAYNIVDPLRPGEAAAKALLRVFDPQADRAYPCGIAVLFPDTHRHEFSDPSSAYLFAEDLEAEDFAARLDAQFLLPAESGDLAQFRSSFNRLNDFLKGHSDNAAIFEERSAQLKKAVEAHKKATPPVAKSGLRMKVAQAQGLPVETNAVVVPVPEMQVVTPPTSAKVSLKARMEKTKADRVALEQAQAEKAQAASPKAVVAAALALPHQQKPLAIAKAERAQATMAIPAAVPSVRNRSLRDAPVQASRQRDMFNWLEEVEQKGEGEAMLSTTQWLMVAGIAVAVICAAYFMARNFAIATAAG